MKDPNKPVLRLYDIPDNTFESDEDSDEDDDAEGTYCSQNKWYLVETQKKWFNAFSMSARCSWLKYIKY